MSFLLFHKRIFRFKRPSKKKVLQVFFVTVIFLTIFTFCIDAYVKHKTQPYLYSSVENIPYNKVGLLLGTAKTLSNGYPNLYYKNRIEAAVKLFKAGKIKYILVSGDNSTKYYNEPVTIKQDLIKAGIPENRIILDYAGFRTLDSVVRSNAVFGQESVTIISQPFHNERAVFIAKAKGINAIGFNAKGVSIKYGLKTNIREKFARVKMILDLMFNVSPKFYGKKIRIE